MAKTTPEALIERLIPTIVPVSAPIDTDAQFAKLCILWERCEFKTKTEKLAVVRTAVLTMQRLAGTCHRTQHWSYDLNRHLALLELQRALEAEAFAEDVAENDRLIETAQQAREEAIAAAADLRMERQSFARRHRGSRRPAGYLPRTKPIERKEEPGAA